MSRLSRRAFSRLALRLAALCASGRAARGAGDRGLGGTGAVPADPEETVGQDRGIGGTGVVGTIRRFGSIVVNDLRIAYPGDVAVTIDGASATAADLRVGQIVHVLARSRGGGLATRAIAVTHEVVGPVDALDRTGLTVLGQRILVERGPHGGLQLGHTVAVAGLRRLDGTIVASLVAPRPEGTSARLAGPVARAQDGTLRIGGLTIHGVRPSLVGRRVVLAGRRIGHAFRASAVAVEPAVPFAGADRLSIEGYVARAGGSLRFGSGVTLAAGHVGPQIGDRPAERAVVTAALDGRGIMSAAEVHREGPTRRGSTGDGQRVPGDHGHHDAPGPNPASAPAAPAAAPRGSPRSQGAPGGGGRGAGSGGSAGGGGPGGGGSPGGPSR